MLWAQGGSPWQPYLPGHSRGRFVAEMLRHKSHHSTLKMAKKKTPPAKKRFQLRILRFVYKEQLRGELGWTENSLRPMAVRHLLRNPKLLICPLLKEPKLICN